MYLFEGPTHLAKFSAVISDIINMIELQRNKNDSLNKKFETSINIIVTGRTTTWGVVVIPFISLLLFNLL